MALALSTTPSATERDPFLSYRGGCAPLAGIRRWFLAVRPLQFFTLGCIFALPSSRLASPADTAALSLPLTQITVSICAMRVEEGGLGVGGEEKSIQHQTMAYRPRGVVCRKVTAIHYVWWPANGQCACRQMDCKHLPCVSIARVARGGARAHSHKRRTRAFRPEMRVNKCLYACMYPLTRGNAHTGGAFKSFPLFATLCSGVERLHSQFGGDLIGGQKQETELRQQQPVNWKRVVLDGK